MKVLIGTVTGQGQRDGDFCYCEGELLHQGSECDTDGDDIDGGCGCRRSLCGVESLKGTTTFLVVDDPKMSIERWACEIYLARLKGGWDVELTDGERFERAIEPATTLQWIAAHFDCGAIVEKRGNLYQERLEKEENCQLS